MGVRTDTVLEMILIAVLLSASTYNIYIIISRKLYRSWSTFNILFSCVMLMFFRILFCIFFILSDETDMKPQNFQLINALLIDFPYFFVCNITLVLIWQWWRIANLLTATESEMIDLLEKKPQKRLYILQGCLVAWITSNCAILIAHYKYGWISDGQIVEEHRMLQSKTYVIVRSCWFVVILSIFLLLCIYAGWVFATIYRVVRDQRSMKSFRR